MDSHITIYTCNKHKIKIKNREKNTKVLSPVISLPSYAIFTDSGSLNTSNTSSSYLITKFSQLPNLRTFITSSLFNVLQYSLFTRCYSCSATFIILSDRSFHYVSPCLWNQFPLSLRQPHSSTSSFISDSPIPSPVTSSSFDSPLCSSITPSVFHSRLKTYLFHKSYPRSFTSSSQTAFHELLP